MGETEGVESGAEKRGVSDDRQWVGLVCVCMVKDGAHEKEVQLH